MESAERHRFCPYCMSPVDKSEYCPICGLTQGAYQPPAHHLPPGTVLNERYLIGRALGDGGFGITYIGCDLRLEAKVAIKEYFPSGKVARDAAVTLEVSRYVSTSAEHYRHELDRFLREARTMARLAKDPAIVTVHDFFEANGTAYIVMEYIDGTTFKELVAQRGGRIPAGELLHIIEPIFFALQSMHEVGLIHRDVSPENIMLEAGRARLLDFGCARDATGGETLTISLKHGYAPIEQYQSRGQGPWTDVYALAATIYFCLTGTKPPQAMDRLIDDELVPPRALGAELSRAQERALLHAMATRPHERLQSVGEFYAALYEAEASVVVPVKEPVEEPVEERVGEERASETEATRSDVVGPTQTETVATPPHAAEQQGTAEDVQATATTAGATPAADGATRASKGASGKKPGITRRAAVLAGLGLVGIAVLVAAGMALTSGNGAATEEPAGETEDAAEDSGEIADASEADATTDEGVASYTIVDGEAYVTDGAEETLRAALADEEAKSVSVQYQSVELCGGVLEVNKSLTLWMDLLTYDSVVVGAGGALTVASGHSLGLNGLLRTCDGGSIVVMSDGDIYAPYGDAVLWLESWDDLTATSGVESLTLFCQGGNVWGCNVDDVFSVDEDALFADAVEAASEDELRDALDDDSVAAVRITEDITLSAWLDQEKPVLICEGVTVNALGEDQELDEDGAITTISGDIRDEGWAWNLGPSVLVNRGTLQGDLHYYCDENDWPVIINYGYIDVSGEFCNTVNLEGATINLSHGGIEAHVVNLGTFTHVPRIFDYGWGDHDGNAFFNGGTLLIEGADDVTSYWDVGDAYLHNGITGTITVGAGGVLNNNDGYLINEGAIDVESGGALNNYVVGAVGRGYEGHGPARQLSVADGAEVTGVEV